MKHFSKQLTLALISAAVFSFNGCQSMSQPEEITADSEAVRPLPFSKLQTAEAKILDDEPIPVNVISGAEAPKLERSIEEMPTRSTSRPEENLSDTEYPEGLLKGIKAADTELVVNLVFDATDISEVVAAFADENLLNFGYLIDPAVKGSVSMSVKSTMTARDAWYTFEHILWLSGAYASKNPGFIHILPFDKMPKERRIFAEHEIQPNVVVDLIPVKYKKSADIINQIKPFMTDGATASDLVDSNTVVIVEAPTNIDKLREIINRLDNKGEREWPAKCFACNEVDADQIANELQTLLPVLGLPIATGTGTSGGAIKITALPRIATIVVSAALPDVVDEVGNWIKALDRSDLMDKEEIYFYNVKHSTVEKLTAALEAFFNTSITTSPTTSTTTSRSTSSRASASTGSNRLNNNGMPNGGNFGGGNFGNGGNWNRNNGGNNRNRTNATNQQRTAGGTGTVNSASTDTLPSLTETVFETEVVVYSDDESNRLTIKTTPRAWNLIKLFLDRQDIAPVQVSIKAIIADITLTKNTEFGISYAATKLFRDGETNVSGVAANAGRLDGLLMGTDPGVISTTTYSTLNGWASGLGLIFQRSNDPLALVSAIAGSGNTKILSEPQLVVRSGAEGYFQGGRSVAIVKESVNYTSSSGNLSNTYSYEDVGVIMTVTPYVTAGHDVRMIVEQEVSDTVASSITTNTPDISKKKIITELIAPDNSTILLGGMIRNELKDSNTGIPFLKDIPGLGWLFRHTTTRNERSELLVLMTVNVLDSDNPQEDLIRRYKTSLEEISKRYEEETY